ncbi:hypothetical protein [Fructobacillus cardui]|uniref:hypothetical protein n=1 Tax=Fructobacillus cardui TaxID=2893170 RepID=UPI0030C85631
MTQKERDTYSLKGYGGFIVDTKQDTEGTNEKGKKMNMFIAILLAVMAGVIFCQKWQMNKFYQSAHFFRYYAKLHENKAIYAEEEAETFRDLLNQLGYDVDRLSNGDKTRKPLTE